MAQPPGMCALLSASALNSNCSSGSQTVGGKRCQGSRVLAISPLFPRIMEVTAAAFAILGKMSADVMLKLLTFPWKCKYWGLLGEGSQWAEKGDIYQYYLWLMNKQTLALVHEPLSQHSSRDPRATSSLWPLLHAEQMQQRKQVGRGLASAGWNGQCGQSIQHPRVLLREFSVPMW